MKDLFSGRSSARHHTFIIISENFIASDQCHHAMGHYHGGQSHIYRQAFTQVLYAAERLYELFSSSHIAPVGIFLFLLCTCCFAAMLSDIPRSFTYDDPICWSLWTKQCSHPRCWLLFVCSSVSAEGVCIMCALLFLSRLLATTTTATLLHISMDKAY